MLFTFSFPVFVFSSLRFRSVEHLFANLYDLLFGLARVYFIRIPLFPRSLYVRETPLYN